MRRSTLSALAFLCVGFMPVSVDAQVTGRAARVGILGLALPPGSPGIPPSPYREALVQGLRDLGWIEGQNLVFEARYAAGKAEQLPLLARELASLRVDVLVTFGGATVQPARKATTTIPIVMIAGSADPVTDGLAKSLAHPGGNVTGLTSTPSRELFGKCLEVLRDLIPGLSRVGLLYDYASPETVRRAWEEAGGRLGLAVQWSVIRDPDELDSALAGFRKQRVGAIYLPLTGATFSYRNRIAAGATKLGIPAFGILREVPDAGGLLSYGPNLTDVYRRAATYVDKVLRGASVATLPIEQPSKFELVLNAKTTKALGLAIPPSLLLRADQVIE